ncbi:ras-specific guanine nucleotide-releasing factor 2-like isoform X1 [Sycon ciliatum]|uniref:ras-specific guanine nucleotide-releasing factor 2-like isoform X1 n=2 Tax=Sycon ciliatum TaxID=27933 RepID=UPI0031F6BDB0
MPLRINEAQLQALALKAKASPARCGWVKKKPGHEGVGSTKWQKRWLVLYQNILYYFETDLSQRPQGVILVELCDCRRLHSYNRPSDAPPETHLFVVGIQGVAQRQYHFATAMANECEQWVMSIQEASTENQLRQLDMLKEQCDRLSSQLEAKTSEVVRLAKDCADQEDELIHIRSQIRADSVHFSPRRDVARRKTLEFSYPLPLIIKLQKRWRLNRRAMKFVRVVDQYVSSQHAEVGRERNRLVWKLIANEEEYVEQLNMIVDLFLRPMRMAAESTNPKVKLEKVMTIFSNIEQIAVVHELFLSGLHQQVKKWPAMRFGWLLDVTFPMFSLYHEYTRNSALSTAMVREVFKADPQGRHPDIVAVLLSFSNLSTVEHLNELLAKPTQQLSHYTKQIQALLQVTPSYHVDRAHLEQALATLDEVKTTIDGEPSLRERMIKTLKVESTIQRGCIELLSPKQVMIRNGLLTHQRMFTTSGSMARKDKKLRERHCYLFSQHLIVCRRITNETLELVKDVGVLPLKGCIFKENMRDDELEQEYGLHANLAFSLVCSTPHGNVSCTFCCGSPKDKASWASDIRDCVSNLQIEETATLHEHTDDFGKQMDAVLLSPEHSMDFNFSRSGPESIRSFQLYRSSSQTELKRIQTESVQSLCQRLVHPKGLVKEYLHIFLATMSAFISHTDFLDFLINTFQQIHRHARHHHPSPVGSLKRDVGKTVVDSPLLTPKKEVVSPLSAIDRERAVLRRERHSEEWSKHALHPLKPLPPPSTGRDGYVQRQQQLNRQRRPALAESVSSAIAPRSGTVSGGSVSAGSTPVAASGSISLSQSARSGFAPLSRMLRNLSSETPSQQTSSSFVAHVNLDSPAGCSPRNGRSKRSKSPARDATMAIVSESAPAWFQSPLQDGDDDIRDEKEDEFGSTPPSMPHTPEPPHTPDPPHTPEPAQSTGSPHRVKRRKSKRQTRDQAFGFEDSGSAYGSAVTPKKADSRKNSSDKKESNRLSISDFFSRIPLSPRRSPVIRKRGASSTTSGELSTKASATSTSEVAEPPIKFDKERRTSSDTTAMKEHRAQRNSEIADPVAEGDAEPSVQRIPRSVSLEGRPGLVQHSRRHEKQAMVEIDENVFLPFEATTDVVSSSDSMQRSDFQSSSDFVPSPVSKSTFLTQSLSASPQPAFSNSSLGSSEVPVVLEEADQWMSPQESTSSSACSSRKTSDNVSPGLAKVEEEPPAPALSVESKMVFFDHRGSGGESSEQVSDSAMATQNSTVTTVIAGEGEQHRDRHSTSSEVDAAVAISDNNADAVEQAISVPEQNFESAAPGESPTESSHAMSEPGGTAPPAAQDCDDGIGSDAEEDTELKPRQSSIVLLPLTPEKRQSPEDSNQAVATTPSSPTHFDSNMDGRATLPSTNRRARHLRRFKSVDSNKSPAKATSSPNRGVRFSDKQDDQALHSEHGSARSTFEASTVSTTSDDFVWLDGTPRGPLHPGQSPKLQDESQLGVFPFDEDFPPVKDGEYCSSLLSAQHPDFQSRFAMAGSRSDGLDDHEDEKGDIPSALRSPWQPSVSADRRRMSFRMTSSLSQASDVSDDVLEQPHLQEHLLLRIFCILRKWLNHHFQDFATNSELLEKLVKFINELSGNLTATDEEVHSLQVIREAINRQQSKHMEHSFQTLKSRYNEAMDRLPQFNSLDNETVAKQLALVGYSVICAMPGKELVSGSFGKGDRRETAPHVMAVSDFYNQVTGLIMWEILQRKNASSRAAAIEKWIAIGDICLTMNNFYAITMITSSMSTSAICRLTKTWLHISKQKMEVYEVLKEVGDPTQNFRAMRDRLHEATFPALPYMGCYQKELIYINETKTKDKDGKVNFPKMKRTYAILKQIQQYQKEPYEVTPDEKVLKYLMNTSHIPNEEALFEQSLRVEPRQH